MKRWGNNIGLELTGSSHAEFVGLRLDGIPAGIYLSDAVIAWDIARRKSGASGTTARREADVPEVLSGITGGKTDGREIVVRFPNADVRHSDYDADVPRPSHADYAARLKYGPGYDFRGGGQFSGRMTLPLVYAGGIARCFLAARGICVGAHYDQIHDQLDAPMNPCAVDAIMLSALREKEFPVLSDAAGARMRAAVQSAAEKGDSVGGVVECAAVGLPGGIGGPLWEGLESRIAELLFAVPAVKGVEFGDGFSLCGKRGSEANDPMTVQNGQVALLENHSGGIQGGISNGMPLIVRAAFKPTPSIAKPQRSVNLARMEEAELRICGRHDACVALRGLAVVEAAVLLVLADALLDGRGKA